MGATAAKTALVPRIAPRVADQPTKPTQLAMPYPDLAALVVASTRGWIRSNIPLDHDEWWVQCLLRDVPYLGVTDRSRHSLVHVDLTTMKRRKLSAVAVTRIQYVLASSSVVYPVGGRKVVAPDMTTLVHVSDDAIWSARIPRAKAEKAASAISKIIGEELSVGINYAAVLAARKVRR